MDKDTPTRGGRAPRPAEAAGSPRPAPGAARIGLALAGGGPLGAIYEIGALCALEEALPGLDFTDLAGYVGVSAGGFICAGLANGMAPRAMCAAFIENEGGADDLIQPSVFVRPAWAEFGTRLRMLPGLLREAAGALAQCRGSTVDVIEILARALPAGVFSNAAIEAHLREVFTAPGRTDDFRKLGRLLVLVATDLDTGGVAPFGLPGWDDVPISRAVAASAALPGLYPPVRIGERHYVDGALKRTIHARVLLDRGIDMLLVLNPLVPFDASVAPYVEGSPPAGRAIPKLVHGGLPVVASQGLRSLIRSRLELGLRGYEATHPQVDIALFEPDRRDPAMFGANTFSYSARRELAEHAYQSTRANLRAREHALAAMFARHGLALDTQALHDPYRHLVALPAPRHRRPPSLLGGPRLGDALGRLDTVLDELQARLAA